LHGLKHLASVIVPALRQRPEIEEGLDVDHSPAINSLPFDPLSPIMVAAELHDDFSGTDWNDVKISGA
jgi:hypothetical protein